MKSSLAVIIPAHNEEKGILKCISSVITELKKIHNTSVLLIVNDGSSDSTLAILKKAKNRYKRKLEYVTYEKNKGYGGALTTGIRFATKKCYTYALIMDSDLTNSPSDIVRFLDKIEEGYDLVKGSRYIRGGRTKNVPFKRQIPSIIGNLLTSFLFMHSLRDNTNGFRIMRLSHAKNIPYKETGFAHILEDLYHFKKMNARITEIPVILTTRKKGSSHFTYTPKVFYSYLKYPLKHFIET